LVRIVDTHTHAFPAFLAAKALDFLSEKSGTTPLRDGTVESLLASMDRAGVEASVVCSIATEPRQFEGILTWSRQIASPRIIPFPSIHPDAPALQEEIGRIAAGGFKGIKLHPEYQGFHIDDDSLAPLYDSLEREGLIVLFHAGYDIGFPDSDRSAPARIANLQKSFPELRVVASHLGGYRRWEESLEHLVGTGVYLDTSYVMGHISDELLQAILLGHRADRLLFGSDTPWMGQRESIDWIRNLGLPPEREELLFGGNAAALLGLGEPNRAGPGSESAISCR
jgi:predicted TIM-barrel fold metal-dependent hydrolase